MFLFEWLQEVFREAIRFYKENFASGGPAGRMRSQLRGMYGRGEIDQHMFHKLRGTWLKGYSIDGELKMLHRQAAARTGIEGGYAERQNNFEIARSLENLYQNRAILEEARYEMELALKAAGDARNWLQKQADSLYQQAQLALPDEEAARCYLGDRHDLVERIQYLQNRSHTLQQNLRQIAALQAELGLYEAELMLLDSNEQFTLARLALHR